MESPLYVFEWKREPESPPQNLYDDADSWFFDDGSASSNNLTAAAAEIKISLASDAIIKGEETPESKAEVVSKLLEDLDHLDRLDDFIKEEPFSSWLEEKVDLPIFENIHIEPTRGYQQQPQPQPRVNLKAEELKAISPVIHHYQNVPQPQNTSSNVQVIQDTNLLLQEFENVFDHVEMTHGQLTPPQSPPLTPIISRSPPLQQQPQPQPQHHEQVQVLTPLQPIHASTFHILQNPTSAIYFQQPPQQIVQRLGLELPPGTPQPDVAHELAVVEELVRSRAENMVESWNNSPSSSSKSPSIIQSPSSPSSSSSSGFSEYSSDPEWIPEPVHNTESDQFVERPSRGRKRAGKPYSRVGPEDKKSRKKEQNKNAATRYRLKKKAEIEEILSEEKGLTDNKVELQAKVSDLQREIKCLKGLMRDLFKAKGLIQ